MTDPEQDATLAALDWAVICSLLHNGRPCTRKAGHIANVHKCGDPAGSRRPVCTYTLLTLRAVPYPACCQLCGHNFEDPAGYIWAVEPL